MAAMGRAARAKAEGHYDWDAILPQVLGRYDGLLAGYRQAQFAAEGVCVTD